MCFGVTPSTAELCHIPAALLLHLACRLMCTGGKLVTLFSAPDYPQFIAEGEDRYHNKAAVLHLTGPDYATPRVESFEAVLPRPQVGGTSLADLSTIRVSFCSAIPYPASWRDKMLELGQTRGGGQ